VVVRFGLEHQRLGEVAAGAVLKHTRDFNLTRDACLSSGLAPQTPAYDVQQACATSLESAILVGNKIAVGQIEAGIAGGVDSASDAPISINEGLRRLVLSLNRAKRIRSRLALLVQIRPSMLFPSVPNVNERRTGLSMGEHCEQMVRQWHISREAQDELALASHTRGLQAYANGFYDDLVIPYLGLTQDNNLRADTSLAKLARLPPAFDRTSGHGTLTAGNSTPLTDGAAAVLLASDTWAAKHGHAPEAWIVDAETAAVDYFGPDAEGLLMAPVYAVPRLLDRNGLTLQDFDYYQIHEAFAGQVLCTLAAWENEDYCKRALGRRDALGAIDRARLNVNGGSVGLGHPFAATGAQILAGAAKQLALRRQQTGRPCRTLVSICAAGGLGATAILESS
jgi:acetyl-CoA C-acetyltransferase